MKKLIFITAILIGSILAANAGGDHYTIGDKLSIHSKILDEERTMIVYTPDSYDMTTQDYPVMYLLDGGTHFFHTSGIVQFLSVQGLMPEMIIVAIKNVDRTRDFSPTHVDKWPTTGGAENFMDFIAKELIPYVNKNYRTHDYKMLVGHSFGGEFATYALLNQPEVFNSYIAISPYMMYDDQYIVKQAKTKLQSSYNNEIDFFMTIGDEPDYFETLAEFEGIVEQKSPKGFELTYVKFDNETHGSVAHKSIYQGLESIYSEWKLSKELFVEGLASIDDHYKMLSQKYGYAINTPEMTINKLGYYYLNEKEMDMAIKVFKENIKRYPKSANVYDSLGEAYENNDQVAEASANYQKAVELAKKTEHPNLGIYEDNLKRMQDKLAIN